MLLKKVDETIFNEFVENSQYNHYAKTTYWGEHKRKEGFIPHYLGMYDGNHLVATVMMLEKHAPLLGSYFYVPWGPCIDYHNESLLKELLSELKKYSDENDVMFLRMDANVERMSKDINGNPIDGFNNEYITDWIIESGLKHKGYGYGYDGSWINRYTLLIDISQDDDSIFNNFYKVRQSIIKRQQLTGVSTRIGSLDDIDHLMKFEHQLSLTQHFKPHSKYFFEELVTSLKDLVTIYITEINLPEYISYLNEEVNSRKYRKDKEALASKQNELQMGLELQKKYGDRLVLAAGLFVNYGSMSWDLYTYTNKEFPQFKATDNLHNFAILDMKAKGVTTYDMVGFSGSTDKSDQYYGLYEYKRSFGSRYTEYIGEFDYIRKEKKHSLYFNVRKNMGRVKRRINHILYKEKAN